MTSDHLHDDLKPLNAAIEQPLNAATRIDAAARSMTDADPAAGLRARVIAKLPATRGRNWMRIAAPVAAAATLGVLWLVAGRGTTGTAVTTGTRNELTQSSSVALTKEVAKLEPASHREPVVPVVPVVPGDDAWNARAIPALPAVTQLTMAPIQPALLSIAPITMEPIVIGPLEGGRR